MPPAYSQLWSNLSHNTDAEVRKIRFSQAAFFFAGMVSVVLASCSGGSEECTALKAFKEKKALSKSGNADIEKLKSDISKCSGQSFFIADSSCKEKLLSAFAKKHDCGSK